MPARMYQAATFMYSSSVPVILTVPPEGWAHQAVRPCLRAQSPELLKFEVGQSISHVVKVPWDECGPQHKVACDTRPGQTSHQLIDRRHGGPALVNDVNRGFVITEHNDPFPAPVFAPQQTCNDDWIQFEQCCGFAIALQPLDFRRPRFTEPFVRKNKNKKQATTQHPCKRPGS